MIVRAEADLHRSLQGLVFVLRKCLIGMLIVGILFGGVTYGVCKKVIAPKYQATAGMYIVSAADTVLQMSDLQIGSSIIKDYIYLIKSRPFIEKVRDRLQLNQMSVSEIRQMISVTNPSDTHSLEISVRSTDEQLAVDIANTLADISVVELTGIMESLSPKVTMRAEVRNNRVSPRMTLSAVISFCVGALLWLLVNWIKYLMDDTVRTAEDISMFLELNVLGMINDEKTVKDNKRKTKRNHHRR